MNSQTQIQSWLEKHPYLQEISNLFSQIKMQSEKYPNTQIDLPDLNSLKESFANGIPLLKDQTIQSLLIDEIANAVSNLSNIGCSQALPESFRNNCLLFHEAVSKDSTLAKEIVTKMLNEELSVFEEYCKEAAIDQGLAWFFGWTATSHIINPHLQAIEKWQEDANWHLHYCPTCGASPVLAQIVKTFKGRQRKLVCGCCQTKWTYKRIGCPYCQNDNHQLLNLLEVEEEADFRIDTCQQCNSYIKTYIVEGQEEAALQDWASIHLDILSQEQGFVKAGTLLLKL